MYVSKPKACLKSSAAHSTGEALCDEDRDVVLELLSSPPKVNQEMVEAFRLLRQLSKKA